MMVSYCRICLPEKVVLAFGPRRADVDVPHDIHPQPSPRSGLFAIPDKLPVVPQSRQDPAKSWEKIYVEGDDEQTKANIVANYPDEFVA